MPLTIPTFSVDAGPYKKDPATGSQLAEPASLTSIQYLASGDGSAPTPVGYRKTSISANINDFVNCQIHPKASASLTVNVDANDLTAADIDLLVNFMRDQIRTLAATDVTIPT